jgi:glutamate dehydrogenase/leucine dehydrogenase
MDVLPPRRRHRRLSRRRAHRQRVLLGLDCDILIPAALEGQITPAQGQAFRARLVLEGANGRPAGTDDVLADRNVPRRSRRHLHAGGVTVSYFEWVQDFSSFFWSETRSTCASTRSWSTP